MKRADLMLLLLEFFDDSEVEYNEIIHVQISTGQFIFYSVASFYMRRDLNQV